MVEPVGWDGIQFLNTVRGLSPLDMHGEMNYGEPNVKLSDVVYEWAKTGK
jgi:hypothetical protein